MSHPFNEEHPYGSAGWASEADLRPAGLFRPKGPQIGYWGKKPLYLDGDAPMITIGGAGSGKLRDLLAFVVCNAAGQRMLIMDPRAEIASISAHRHAIHGENAWHWNPLLLCGLPGNRCNLLDILDPRAATFHADCRFIAEGLIPLGSHGENAYFVLRAREWVENLLKSLAEKNGVVSLPALHRIINMVEGDRRRWADHLEAMLRGKFEGVRRCAGEMLVKQQDSPKEFGSIMGEIYAYLGFLDDPALLAALENPEFSLADLCHADRACKVFLNVPAEYLSIWSPVLRLFFIVTMLYKARAPEAPRVTLLCDEAGQLGNFEALLRAFTYGRGAGLRAWAIFQDAGQIVRNFGPPALQGFLGSAQMRQFFGVRDYETAQLISNMLGTQTLESDDTLRQEAAKRQRREAVRNLLIEGGDPYKAAQDIRLAKFEETYRTKQARSLMSADEILAMSEDRQILFIAGKNLRPVYAAKYPYYFRPEMAGKYLGNPYHPPVDQVPIAGRFFAKRARIITEAVPPEFAAFAQYAGGSWSYVKGYKPRRSMGNMP